MVPSDSIHRFDADAALRSLNSGPDGPTTAEALTRAHEFGPNALERVKGRSALAQLLAQFTHFFAVILWTAAGLAALAEAWNPGSGMATLAAAVVAVILINGLFSFWQERRAYHALEALQRLLPSAVRVRRNGLTSEQPATTLVPGDVISLAEGDQIPADCRLIEAFDLRIDNATLTGESVPVGRDAKADLDTAHDVRAQQRNMVLAGTAVVAGEASAVVVATGMHTEFGRLAHLTQIAPERIAPLQREIAALSRLIAFVSVLLGVDAVRCRPCGRFAVLEQLRVCHRRDCRQRARRALADLDTVDGDGRAAYGCASHARPPSTGGRGARLGHRHLHRQNRHADRGPHASPEACRGR